MIGFPSFEKGMIPAQVRLMGSLLTKGITSDAWPRLTSMPPMSGV